MPKHIVIISTLDTKGEEVEYLKRLIEDRKFSTILLDVGTAGDPTILPDITAAEVAAAAGKNIHVIRASKDTRSVTNIMIRGARIKAKKLLEEELLDGIISIGGASNTMLASKVMETLPFGIPKLIVSSAASMPAYCAKYIGTKDITMMHSVVDISGVNSFAKDVLERAAGSICGMVDATKRTIRLVGDSPLIALTVFKFAESCATYVRKFLSEKRYNVIPFHAQGIGDSAMEELIDEGYFDGIIDLVPSGVSEQLLGGNRAAIPRRLEAAGRRGIPQVLTPCGFEMISCGPLTRSETDDPLWAKLHLAERKVFIADEFRVQARTTAAELRSIASVVAEKLSQSKGPVKFLVPTKGWSSLSVRGGALYEPESDAVFVRALRTLLSPDIEVIEVPVELNSAEFAEAIVQALGQMISPGGLSGQA